MSQPNAQVSSVGENLHADSKGKIDAPEYDGICNKYDAAMEVCLGPMLVWPTVHSLLQTSGVATANLLVDLACGTGSTSRIARAMGARSVLGVDISSGMIELARRLDDASGITGTEYVVGSAADVELPDKYHGAADVVLAAFLLHYARSREELCAMIAQAYGLLRPGGRFVGIINNPLNIQRVPGSLETHGTDRQLPPEYREGVDSTAPTAPLPDGFAYRVRVGSPAAHIAFTDFFFDPKTYDGCFKSAGFAGVAWLPMVVADAAAARPAGHTTTLEDWELFAADGTLIAFEAVKPME